MINVKQIILVRSDIIMNPGKIAAQVAHASLAVVLNKMRANGSQHSYHYDIDDDCPFSIWINKSFTKVVLSVPSLTELETIEAEAGKRKLPVCKITDEGRTVFDGIPTVTCMAIGPTWNGDFIGLTDHLALLN